MTVSAKTAKPPVPPVPPVPPGPRPLPRRRWIIPALALILWLIVGGPLAGLAGKTSEIQKNDNASYLPESAESTTVLNLGKRFAERESAPGIVVFARDSGLTAYDKTVIAHQLEAAREHLGDKLAGPPVGPVYSADGKAAQAVVLFAGTDSQKNASSVVWLRDHLGDRETADDGLQTHVTGPAGIFTDFMDVFKLIDGVLLYITGGLILLILAMVYRSPFLPLVVLTASGFALSVANGIVYLLAKADLITVSGQSQGILDVLVLGAATDYALLIVSRFREELRRSRSKHDAMKVALRASFAPILASGGTVILGLLCLLVSDLAPNRGLGPIAAIGIGCALAASLTLLPAMLVLFGRRAFWPFRPAYGSVPAEERGLWARVARVVGRRPRVVWLLTAVILAGCTVGMSRLQADGFPQTESFTQVTDSKAGQALLGRHFPGGAGYPTEVVVAQDRLGEALAAVNAVPGVDSAAPYTGTLPVPGQPPAPPKVVTGPSGERLVRIDATLADAADSPQADQTVERIRSAVHGLGAQVGGYTAINLDVQTTSQRDRNVILPLVLAVVFLVLTLLLRSLIAPILLIATVVLSFFATLGVSGVVFRDVLHYPGADSSYPLFAFVFLVALGVDYNIFLMTRVREEAGRRGHRAGTLTGLSVTGGVITSAGVVLAATFAALAVLPMVFLVELAFTVAFGVLLDTLIVRSLLVPALTIDVGRVIWWPGGRRFVLRP
jgi:RND superfamily putative drug exporter